MIFIEYMSRKLPITGTVTYVKMPSNKIISGIVLKKRKEEESNPWSSVGYLTIKSTLAFVNLLIFIFGIALIIIGINIIKVFKFGTPSNLSVAIMLCGIFICVVGAVGTYGVLSERGMYLKSYIILISLAIIIQLILTTLLMTQAPDINAFFENLFNSSIGTDLDKVEYIQDALECCGYSSIRSACKYSQPCGPKITEVFTKLAIPIGVVTGIEAALIMICLLYISCLVRKQTISNKEINQAWKQNNESIQKDYAKFDYA